MNYTDNKQLQLAYNFVAQTNKNLFLTGRAGTGKTTFLQNLKSKIYKRLIVVAPTGVAAINAGGVTIHSFFQLPFSPFLPEIKREETKKFSRTKLNLIKSLDLLIIDEVSMVRADLLDAIDEVLRRLRRSSKPFGGVQLLLIGDVQQLAPVVKDDEWQLLKNYYQSMYFFGSKALQDSGYECIELQKIYRQTDSFFIHLLEKIRLQNISHEELNQLNKRYLPDFNPPEKEGYITLCSHNAAANQINQQKMDQLPGKTHIFTAEIKGNFPEYSYPTDLKLQLKEGAQVMFVKNDISAEKLFYNGKIGRITHINNKEVWVMSQGGGDEICVKPLEWENINYTINHQTKVIEETVLGSFKQYPLKPAWAITIHKSQGLTFDKAIVDAEKSFAHGQVYVALSRCKTFEGLVLKNPLSAFSLKTDAQVNDFQQVVEQNEPDDEKLFIAQQQYQIDILIELFDFSYIEKQINQLSYLMHTNKQTIPESTYIDMQKLRQHFSKKVHEVGQKFGLQVRSLHNVSELPQNNQNIINRVIKASEYFKEIIENEFRDSLKNLDLEVDNKEIRSKLLERQKEINTLMAKKINLFKISKLGLNFEAIVKTKAVDEIEVPGLISTLLKLAKTPKNVQYPELYQQLRQWRDKLATEAEIDAFKILPLVSLEELSNTMPQNNKQLIKIKGIGKKKVEQFGDEILEIIKTFANNKGFLQASPLAKILQDIQPEEEEEEEEKPKPKKEKGASAKISLNLFTNGQTITEIAKQRNLAESTILGHLAGFVVTGEVKANQLLSTDKLQKLVKILVEKPNAKFEEIKTDLNDKLDYNELKIAQNQLAFLNLN